MKAQYRPWIRITFLVTLLYSFGVVVLIAFLDLAINPLFTTIFYNYPSWCGMTSQCQGYSEPSLFQLLLAGAPWRNGVSESFFTDIGLGALVGAMLGFLSVVANIFKR
ncbi:hypothetical protein [Cupriavidus sp. 2SB]|uniref:hypothetical protein n=1 Tax=Cupriavidus sp. 2SB TaxID=2502199 RepID=UPI0010F6ADDD|nr:hypothetical protein [Cupriavidus sp. 2SB]